MAAAYRSHNVLALGSRTNSTLTAPSGIANGDLLLAIITGGDSGDSTGPTITPPVGWSTATGSGVNVDDTADTSYAFKINVFYKVAASEAGNYTFTHGAADSSGIIYAFTGVDTSSPLSPNMTTNRGGRIIGQAVTAGQTSIALGLTPTVNGSAIVFASACWDDAGPTVPPAGTTPTFTERYDPGTAGILYVADGVLATAGATGDKSNTNGNSSSGNTWGAVLICLKAAAAGGGTTLTAAAGAYALTGTSAGLGGRAIVDPGSYALTGTAATFAFKFTAEAATSGEGVSSGGSVNFVVAGAPVTLTALGGSYALTGTSAGVGGRAILDPGSYALTGTAVTWRLTAPATAGAYTLTGEAATFLHGMIAGNSGYTVNGTDITFRITSGDYTLFCDAGAYALTGRDAAFPGNEPLPPVQPSTGGSGYAGAWSGPKRRKRKRDEIEELIDAVIQAPPPRAQPFTAPQPPPPALVDLLPKMEAVGLTPPQRRTVKRAIVTDDPDDDDEAIELLLNLLS